MTDVLTDKKIVVGVTGGIAAYKAVDLVSQLKKSGAQVKVIMTNNAREFVSDTTFEAISANPVNCDMFRRTAQWDIEHIALAKWAELFVLVPATANIIGKICSGIADDTLSTTIMATKAHVIIAPAMNTQMYENAVVKRNILTLKELGYTFVDPASGRLACGDWGEGKLADIENILSAIKNYFRSKFDLIGTRVLVTAGPTREYLDPVRFISNPSSGKMGIALAKACSDRGAEVTLILGPTSIPLPINSKVLRVETADEMYAAVLEHFDFCDILFKAAAVSDYKPIERKSQKTKKGDDEISINLVKTPDILKEAGLKKTKQIVVGFAAETDNLKENAIKKLKSKNLDYILANDVSIAGAGFEKDTNEGFLICRDEEIVAIPNMNKSEFADRLIDEIIKRENGLTNREATVD